MNLSSKINLIYIQGQFPSYDEFAAGQNITKSVYWLRSIESPYEQLHSLLEPVLLVPYNLNNFLQNPSTAPILLVSYAIDFISSHFRFIL